jgi:hypothetical protein
MITEHKQYSLAVNHSTVLLELLTTGLTQFGVLQERVQLWLAHIRTISYANMRYIA